MGRTRGAMVGMGSSGANVGSSSGLGGWNWYFEEENRNRLIMTNFLVFSTLLKLNSNDEELTHCDFIIFMT